MNNAEQKFDIYAADGMRRIYKNMQRDNEVNGYSWGNGYGFLTDWRINVERWVVVPAAETKRDAA